MPQTDTQQPVESELFRQVFAAINNIFIWYGEANRSISIFGSVYRYNLDGKKDLLDQAKQYIVSLQDYQYDEKKLANKLYDDCFPQTKNHLIERQSELSSLVYHVLLAHLGGITYEDNILINRYVNAGLASPHAGSAAMAEYFRQQAIWHIIREKMQDKGYILRQTPEGIEMPVLRSRP